jgi:regulator of protease activity HflC (stomatin/prohibitin superfamily)
MYDIKAIKKSSLEFCKVALALIILLVFRDSFYVNTWSEMSVITNIFSGKTEITGSGTHLKIPFFERQNVVSIGAREILLSDFTAITKGKHKVIYSGLTVLYITGNKTNSTVLELSKKKGSNLGHSKLFSDLIVVNLQEIISGYSVNEVVKKRGEIRNKLFNLITKEYKKYNIIVIKIQLGNEIQS